jgi:hypothetical protein
MDVHLGGCAVRRVQAVTPTMEGAGMHNIIDISRNRGMAPNSKCCLVVLGCRRLVTGDVGGGVGVELQKSGRWWWAPKMVE